MSIDVEGCSIIIDKKKALGPETTFVLNMLITERIEKNCDKLYVVYLSYKCDRPNDENTKVGP